MYIVAISARCIRMSWYADESRYSMGISWCDPKRPYSVGNKLGVNIVCGGGGIS
jgi:hypothetical protein